jgi:hypothetical protein
MLDPPMRSRKSKLDWLRPGGVSAKGEGKNLPQNPEKAIVISAMMVERPLRHFGFHRPIAWHPLTPSNQKGKSEAIWTIVLAIPWY